MKTLLIVKTGHTVSSLRAQWEDFEDWIIEGSAAPEDGFRVVSVFNDEPLPHPDACAGVLITGSPANVTDNLAWMRSTCDWLREAIRHEVPVLGICFGHQLLAHALGGEVDFHPGGREIGTQQVTLTEAGTQDRLLGKLPQRFHAQTSHLQTVRRLPEGAVVLAQNEFEPHHAVRYDDRVWGLQFHPEFSRRVMIAYIEERRAVLEKEGFSYRSLLAQVQDTPAAAALLSRFVATAVG